MMLHSELIQVRAERDALAEALKLTEVEAALVEQEREACASYRRHGTELNFITPAHHARLLAIIDRLLSVEDIEKEADR